MLNKYTLLLAGAVVIIVAPFAIKGPDGKPLASFSTAKNTLMEGIEPVATASSKIADTVNNTLDDMKSEGGTEQSQSSGVYRWKGKDGVWHYGDAPPDINAAESVAIDTRANIIQAVESKPTEQTKKSKVTVLSDSSSLSKVPVLGTAAAAADLKSQISELEQQLQTRDEQLQSIGQ